MTNLRFARASLGTPQCFLISGSFSDSGPKYDPIVSSRFFAGHSSEQSWQRMSDLTVQPDLAVVIMFRFSGASVLCNAATGKDAGEPREGPAFGLTKIDTKRLVTNSVPNPFLIAHPPRRPQGI